jgi:hypothetical protein
MRQKLGTLKVAHELEWPRLDFTWEIAQTQSVIENLLALRLLSKTL